MYSSWRIGGASGSKSLRGDHKLLFGAQCTPVVPPVQFTPLLRPPPPAPPLQAVHRSEDPLYPHELLRATVLSALASEDDGADADGGFAGAAGEGEEEEALLDEDLVDDVDGEVRNEDVERGGGRGEEERSERAG